MFFGNSSLEMVYIEAIANALDANANKVNIEIKAQAFNKPETLTIKIFDNGDGFTDQRYKRFSKLFNVEEKSHKGLGRLVYLFYFGNVKIESSYDSGKVRIFEFNEQFEEEEFTISNGKNLPEGTSLYFQSYSLQKLGKNEYLKPTYLKMRILEEFYPRFYKLKENGLKFDIKISSNIGESNSSQILNGSDIPKFKKVNLKSTINLIDKFYLYYSIKKIELNESSFLAAIAVDDRTKKVELIAEENIPTGYEMIFLFFSDYFIGKVDSSRQSLNISSSELNIVQAKFRNEIAKIIETKIPSVKERNTKTKLNLQNKYPHLNGYFDAENIGYISRVDILKNAQDKFFKAQKEILEASHLNDEQYEKSLEISARALTEYILFRQQTIKRLKSTTKENSEAEIHRLFATMRNEGKFEKENATEDIYRNNSWLLDDKFMTYETLLSDQELSELVSFITDGEDAEAAGRPDLAFVFSNNPNNKKPFDVVIVELKKRGVKLKEKMSAITQLEERARKLSKYYKNQIQRIWYYGIIDIDEETELALLGQFTELYSTGKMFYREMPVAISKDPLKRVPIAVFIWDLDAVIDDASSRNSSFLNLLKSKFSNQ